MIRAGWLLPILLALAEPAARAQARELPPRDRPPPAFDPAEASAGATYGHSYDLVLIGDAGYGLLGFAGLRAHGISGGLGFGQRRSRFAVYARLDFFHGDTEEGLSVSQLTIGVGLEGVFNRLRVGGGTRFGGVIVDRVGAGQDPMGAFTLGPWLGLGVDVARWKSGALYLGAEAAVDLGLDGPIVFSGGLHVGARLL